MSKKEQMSQSEMETFMERLRARPELYEQFSRILDLSDPKSGGKGLDLNLLESFLKPEIRETGRVAVSEFAMQTEATCADVVKGSQMQQREKKL
jgi:hypothetical protein